MVWNAFLELYLETALNLLRILKNSNLLRFFQGIRSILLVDSFY